MPLLNLCILLTNSTSRQAVFTMMSSQHAFLLLINFVGCLLTSLALSAVLTSPSRLEVREMRLGSLIFFDMLGCIFGLLINVLYFMEVLPCSGNCLLSYHKKLGFPARRRMPGNNFTDFGFEPDLESTRSCIPTQGVSLLRYCTDVTHSLHYIHLLLGALHLWMCITRPMLFQRLDRCRNVLWLLALAWSTGLIQPLPAFVYGFFYRQEYFYILNKVFFLPVVHALHAAVVFCLYYGVADTTVHHIQKEHQMEKMVERFRRLEQQTPVDEEMTTRSIFEKLRTWRKSTRVQKISYVVLMYVLIFGTFLLVMSPAVYFKAFRMELPSTVGTLCKLLVVEALASTHVLFTVSAVMIKNATVREQLKSFRKAITNLCNIQRTEIY